MLKNVCFILCSSLCFLHFTGCSKSNGGGGGTPTPGFCDGVTSKYSTDVQPIIATSCLLGSGCHSAGSTNTGGELTDHAKVFIKRVAIKAAINAGTMPQTGSLTTDQKKKIICWIDAGAVNN